MTDRSPVHGFAGFQRLRAISRRALSASKTAPALCSVSPVPSQLWAESLGKIRKDGAHVWIRAHSARFPQHELPGPLGVIVIEDITAHRRLEQALHEEEKLLELIYENVSEIIAYVAVEPDGFRFVSVNRAFCQATGAEREEVIGKRVEEVVTRSPIESIVSVPEPKSLSSADWLSR